jgi:hypothetical protein
MKTPPFSGEHLMELTLPVYQVEVAMPSFLLRGDFQPRGDFLIYLNDRSYSYLRFDDATLLTLSSDYQIPHVRQSSMTLNRQLMTYVAIMQEEQAERLQILQTKRAAVFYSDWCAIRGNLHVSSEVRDDDLLGQARDFLAVSNASIFPLRTVTAAPTAKAPLVMVNRHALTACHVHRPKDE